MKSRTERKAQKLIEKNLKLLHKHIDKRFNNLLKKVSADNLLDDLEDSYWIAFLNKKENNELRERYPEVYAKFLSDSVKLRADINRYLEFKIGTKQ